MRRSRCKVLLAAMMCFYEFLLDAFPYRTLAAVLLEGDEYNNITGIVPTTKNDLIVGP